MAGFSKRVFFVTYAIIYFLLLKCRRFAIRFGFLTFILFILLIATHHYYIFTAPFIISFIVITLFSKLKGSFKLSNNFISILFFMGLIGMFLIPFFTGIFYSGSRYQALYNIIENNIRTSGPIIFFAIGGIIYIILKSNKEFGEWLFLLGLIITVPSLYIDRYAQFISSV